MTKIKVKKNKVNIKIAGTRLYPQLEDLEITPTVEEQNFKSTKYGYNNVKVKPIEILLQNKEVTPTEETQEVTSDSEYDALKKVVVNPIPNNYNETSDATATENDIALGKTAYAGGIKITGTLNNDNNAKIVTTFTSKTIIEQIEKLPVIDCSKLTDISSLFRFSYKLKEIGGLINTEKFTSTSYMFGSAGQSNESADILKIPFFDTRNVTNMSNMFASAKITEIPLLDTSNVTDMNYMFSGSSIQTIPLLNTSNVTNMSGMFRSAGTKTIPLLDTHNVTNMTSMFEGNEKIQYVPLFDTSNVTGMSSMFRMAYSLLEIPSFNTEKVTNFSNFLYDSGTGNKFMLQKIGVLDMRSATTLPNLGYAFTNLTDLGGFPNVGMAFDPTKAENSYTLKFGYTNSKTLAPPLTRESILNVLNGLYDIASIGVKPQKIQFFKVTTDGKITDEDIAIATNKGWNVVI